MTRNLAPLFAACIALSGLIPAMAEDSAKGVAMIPVRMVSFATGAVVGTPIAVLRKVCANASDMSGDASDHSENPAVRVTSGLFLLPFAALKGGVEGVYMGTANSWKHSSDKPFSADSFSLGEMDKE